MTALYPVVAARNGTWVGWAGGSRRRPEAVRARRNPALSDPAQRRGCRAATTRGQSNATIWPLYHDAVEPPVFHRHWRNAYREVNQRFADAAAEVAADGATVWVHDYQLQLVPAMLRELRPDLRIGFFLHIPFPPIELFMQMPLRAQILRVPGW